MPQVLDRRDEIPLKQRDDEKEPKLNKTEGRPNTAALIKRQQPDSPFLGEPGCCCSGRRGEDPAPSGSYLSIALTTPAPTVRPPSRMVKRWPTSMAIGAISLMPSAMLSPGMTISVPSGSSTVPVTSVVRK